MRIGFTGTRRGMTEPQSKTLELILKGEEPGVFVHGDCVGADAQAHEIAKKLGWSIELRPCNNRKMRAWCNGWDICHPEKPPLERNIEIVRTTEILIAAPNEPIEVMRSGTWTTIRCSRRFEKRRALLWPQGGWIWE